MRKLAVILFCGVLSGCALWKDFTTEKLTKEDYDRLKRENPNNPDYWPGKPEGDVLRYFGVPDKETTLNNTKVIQYDKCRRRIVQSGVHISMGKGNSTPPMEIKEECTFIIFFIKNGIVEKHIKN